MSTPLSMPRSHPLATRARPPGPPGAQAGLGSGSLKSVVRACFLLPQSRAPLLFSSAPAVLPPSFTTRHDTTRFNSARSGRRLSHQRPSRRPPSLPSLQRRHQTDGGAHHPTVSAKKHTRSLRLDRNPTETQSQPPRDQRWSDPTPVLRIGARTQPASNTRHL